MSCLRLARADVHRDGAMDAERERLELDRYDAEGVALINTKLAAIQRIRAHLWRLARIPRSKRNSLHAEEISLAWFQLAQLRFALARLSGHLGTFRKGRQRAEQASTLR